MGEILRRKGFFCPRPSGYRDVTEYQLLIHQFIVGFRVICFVAVCVEGFNNSTMYTPDVLYIETENNKVVLDITMLLISQKLLIGPAA